MRKRVLIVANGFVNDAPRALPAELLTFAEPDSEMHVIVPAHLTRLQSLCSDLDQPRADAQDRLDRILQDMTTLGLSATGHTADEDQLLAIENDSSSPTSLDSTFRSKARSSPATAPSPVPSPDTTMMAIGTTPTRAGVVDDDGDAAFATAHRHRPKTVHHRRPPVIPASARLRPKRRPEGTRDRRNAPLPAPGLDVRTAPRESATHDVRLEKRSSPGTMATS
jgi:hypothetical protein